MSDEHRLRSSFSFNPETDVTGAMYVGQLWLYSLAVLYPAQAIKRMGVFVKTSVGRYPAAPRSPGEGQLYSREYSKPVYCDHEPVDDDSIGKFGRVAELYETVVVPFTHPIHAEALTLIKRLLRPTARILDLGCGPGTELFHLAQFVVEGEVVGIDLSTEMLATAHAGAQKRCLRNTAFFQADVTNLPGHFTERFDAIHCSFAFHHYRDPVATLREMHRVLNGAGKAFVIDGATWWAKAIGSPFAKVSDPGWVKFYTGEEFQVLFRESGFSDFYWEELLPGIGICIGTK